MGKHQKGVNPKLHFPPYSLLNKVPAFIQQPNWEWGVVGRNLSLSSSSSQPIFWQFQNKKWKVGESAWDLVSLLPVKLLLNALWSFTIVLTDKPKPRLHLQKTRRAGKRDCLQKTGSRLPILKKWMQSFPPPLFFFFSNYSLLPLLPPTLKQCWRREKKLTLQWSVLGQCGHNSSWAELPTPPDQWKPSVITGPQEQGNGMKPAHMWCWLCSQGWS